MPSIFDAPVSLGETITSNKVRSGFLRWSDFEDATIFNGDVSKKDGKYFMPSRHSGSLRTLETIVDVNLIVFDVDKMSREDFAHARERMQMAGLEFMHYTTLRHCDEQPRYRLILKPSRPMTPDEYRHLIPKLAADLGLVIDPSGANPNQLMFLPMVTPDGEYRVQKPRAGKPVDVDAYTADLDRQALSIEAENELLTQELNVSATPAGLTESAWLSFICEAYPAHQRTYEEWAGMGMALHHQSGGRGFELWLAWAEADPDWTGRLEVDKMKNSQWPSFAVRPGQRRVKTLKTILATRREGTTGTVKARAYVLAIRAMGTPEELHRLIGTIAEDRQLSGSELRQIARDYREAVERVGEEHMTLQEAQTALATFHITPEESDLFYNRYVFDRIEGKYIDLWDRKHIDDRVINYRHRSMMPAGRNGSPMRVNEVLEQGGMGYRLPREVTGRTTVFGHDAPDVVPSEDQADGLDLNRYNSRWWPRPGLPHDPADAIDRQISIMIDKHFNLLTNNDERTVKLMLQMLAFMRQRPNQRITWAMVFTSKFEGIGKSILRSLYNAVLGEALTNKVNTDVLQGKYNAWAAEPVKMTFCEEFDFLSGTSKIHTVANLKDFLTTNKLMVEQKFQSAHVAPVTTSLMIFCNVENPLGDQILGRRWLQVSTHVYNREQAAEKLGEDHEQFYGQYALLMREHPERFTAYFESIDIEDFDPHALPRWAHNKKLTVSEHTAIVVQQLQYYIDRQTTPDITQDYVYVPSLTKLIENECLLSDEPHLKALVGKPHGHMDKLVRTALERTYYIPLDAHPMRNEDRVPLTSIPFESNKRPRDKNVYTRGIDGVYIEQKARIVARRVKEDIEKRKSNPPVINLDGTRYSGPS